MIESVPIFAGILAFLMQVAVSIMKRDELRDLTGDPWHGRTLEWATSSPPDWDKILRDKPQSSVDCLRRQVP